MSRSPRNAVGIKETVPAGYSRRDLQPNKHSVSLLRRRKARDGYSVGRTINPKKKKSLSALTRTNTLTRRGMNETKNITDCSNTYDERPSCSFRCASCCFSSRRRSKSSPRGSCPSRSRKATRSECTEENTEQTHTHTDPHAQARTRNTQRTTQPNVPPRFEHTYTHQRRVKSTVGGP